MSALKTQVGGDHYKQGAIQPVEFIESNRLGFLEGCVIKRMARHDKPTGKGRQDIEKAIHELQLLLELRYPQSGITIDKVFGPAAMSTFLQRAEAEAKADAGRSDPTHGGDTPAIERI